MFDTGTKMRDQAGHEYEVLEREVDNTHQTHSQHAHESLHVRRDDGTTRWIARSTVMAMYRSGQLELLP